MDESLYEKIFELALKENVAYVDIRDEDSLYNTIEVIDGKVQTASTGSEAGIGIRILKEGVFGFAYGSKEHHKEVFQMALNAQKTSKKLSEDNVELVPVDINKDKVIIKQKKPIQDVSFEEKMKLVLETDKHLRDDENKIKSTRSFYVDILRRQTLATSEGSLIYEERPYTNFYMSPTARKGTETNQGLGRAGHVGGFELFDVVDVVKRAEETKMRTITGLEAKPIKPGKYSVILDGSLNFLFAHEAVGHSAEADFLRAVGVLRGKLNKKIAPNFVNLVDDGTLEYIPGYKSRTFGFMRYDDEGVRVERTEIIKKGILKTYLTDRANATHFNIKPTGNCRAEYYSNFPLVRMRNTFLEASKGNNLSENEILELVKNGALLKGAGGGEVSTIRGTFNFSASDVYEIKNSEISDVRRATTLSGNTLETLGKLLGISNKMTDPSANTGFCGKDGQRAPTGTGGGWCAVKIMTLGG